MKNKTIITSILGIVFLIYSVWSFIDWAKKRQNKTWTDKQIELMIENCISSSNYLSSVDSVTAHSVCACAIEKLIEKYTYNEIWKFENHNRDSLVNLFTPIMEDCMFPLLYKNKHTIITDTTKLKWISNSIASFWKPTDEDYKLAESILEGAIINTSNENWTILNEYTAKNYYRQYVFYKDSNGDMIVYINAFYEIFQIPTDSSGVWVMKPYDWKSNLMIVNDGGDYYWSIKINLTKKTYVDFRVNGVA